MTFEISSKTPIYLYGAGNLGIYTYDKLLSTGYNVLGILDQKGALDKHVNVDIFKPEEEPYVEDACIIICLLNGLHHIPVAQKLYSRGYTKILLLPMHLNSRPARTMISQFNHMISDELELLTNIPLYDELWKVNANDYFLREEGQFVTVLVPVSHIYTNKRKFEGTHPFEVYSPEVINTPAGFHHDSPIETAMNYTDDAIRKRDDLYSMYERVLFEGLEFFIDSAPPARYDLKGYFNLLDGHHRSSFLLHRGFKGIPVRVLKTEYEIYFNQKAASDLMDYSKTLETIPFEVTHPAFVRFPVQNRKDTKFENLSNQLSYYNIRSV
jgi:hypothetical protein